MIDLEELNNSEFKIQNQINRLNGTTTLFDILSDSQKIDKDVLYQLLKFVNIFQFFEKRKTSFLINKFFQGNSLLKGGNKNV